MTLSYGQQVREQRRVLKLSQDEAATRIGISRNYLSLIERDQATNLSADIASRIEQVLGVRYAGTSQGPHERWEYVTAALPADWKEQVAGLNVLGDQGWELVAVEPVISLESFGPVLVGFFKRKRV